MSIVANGATLQDLGVAMDEVGCVLKWCAMLSCKRAFTVGVCARTSAYSLLQRPLSNTFSKSHGESVEVQQIVEHVRGAQRLF